GEAGEFGARVAGGQRRRGDVAETGEDDEIVIGNVQPLAALCRENGQLRTVHGVVGPDAVLGEERNPAEAERPVLLVVLVGDSGSDLAEVAFEEERLQTEVALELELVAEHIAAEAIVRGDAAGVE